MKNFCEYLFFFFFFFFFFFGDRLKNFCEDLFFFFFGEHLRFVSLVLGLGLEHSCPWPRECLSSERLSLALALASDFFVSLALALASSLVSSTPPLASTLFLNFILKIYFHYEHSCVTSVQQRLNSTWITRVFWKPGFL